MAKKKNLVKRKKIIYKKTKTQIPVLYFVVAFCFVLAIFIFGILKLSQDFRASSIKINSKMPLNKEKQLNKILISPYPTKSISQTPTPSPTPTPLTGFCLRVPVLMYHHIAPQATAKEKGQTALTVDSTIFENQMQYLAQKGYTTLFANELVDALRNHTGLPAKPVVITFDDGYADNFIYALPVLQKYNLKANLMLASGLVGSNQDMLSLDQVKGLSSSGLIYFTNHTWSHFTVNHGTQEKINLEIDTAKSQIQNITGQNVSIFTYPYGAFNNNVISILVQKGYIGAFSSIPGFYQCDSFLMTLHRTRIGNSSLLYYGL